MALDPRLLQSFVVLTEELHFGRAAERLTLAQSALSQQIIRLERQIGAPLFTRNSRIVEPTDAGRAMLEPARASLRAIEQAERAAREAARVTEHPLKVGVDSLLDDVVPALCAYASDHSEVSLWVARMHEAQGLEVLAAAQVDAFIGCLPPTANSQLPRIRAMDVPLHAVVSPQDPLARRAAVPLASYRRSPVAIASREHEPERFDYFVDILSEGRGSEALAVREVQTTGTASQSAILAEVAAGQAVSFGSPATLAATARHLCVLPFDPPVSIPAYVSWQADRSAVVDAFVDHLRAEN